MNRLEPGQRVTAARDIPLAQISRYPQCWEGANSWITQGQNGTVISVTAPPAAQELQPGSENASQPPACTLVTVAFDLGLTAEALAEELESEAPQQ